VGFFWFARQGKQPGLLKEAGVALIRRKTIQIAKVFLATKGSEGSDRK